MQWLVHPHSRSLTISPAPGCSLIPYPTKADHLSKTYLSLLYSLSGSYFFFSREVVAALSPHSKDLLWEAKNYIIQEGKYCLTFALRGCLIHVTLLSFLTLFSFTLTSSVLFFFNPPSLYSSPFHLHLSNVLHSHLLILSPLVQIFPSLHLLSSQVYFLSRPFLLKDFSTFICHLLILSYIQMIMQMLISGKSTALNTSWKHHLFTSSLILCNGPQGLFFRLILFSWNKISNFFSKEMLVLLLYCHQYPAAPLCKTVQSLVIT